MRRVAALWPQVVAFANLRRAAARAARGKRQTASGARFLDQLEPQLFALQRQLAIGAWRPSLARRFEIHDPKRRTITAVPFVDRVVHHALIGPLEPLFERRMVAHSYACRSDKGAHRALAYARQQVRRHPFALKLDVAAFFPSLQHDVVLATLRRLIKDADVLDLSRTILRGAHDGHTNHDRGLPIGSLTSQWFANVTLNRLDHFVLEQRRPRGYVRYMDDFVLFGSDKARLHEDHAAIAAFLREQLGLNLKDRATRLMPTWTGLPFLGFSLFPGLVRVQSANLRRYRWRLRFLRWQLASGEIDAEHFRRGVAAVMNHLAIADTLRLRRRWSQEVEIEM